MVLKKIRLILRSLKIESIRKFTGGKDLNLYKNGVCRPRSGTKTGRIWDKADEVSNLDRKPVSRKVILAFAKKSGLNVGTSAVQYCLWRKYWGLQKTE